MARDYRFHLQDMANSIGKVNRYTDGVDFGRFSTDELIEDAVVRNLWIIAEAANKLPAGFRASIRRSIGKT